MKVINVSILLSEYIRRVKFATDVLYINDVGLYVFVYCIFADLNVTGALGCHVVRPLDCGCIIVVNLEWLFIYDCVVKGKILDDVDKLLDRFGTFIYCTYFCVSRAACSVTLSFGNPIERASPPYDVTSD